MPSKIKFSKKQFLEVIKTSSTHQEAASKLGYGRYSYSAGTLYRKFMMELKPDTSHFSVLSRSIFDKKYSKVETFYNSYKRDANRRNRNYNFELSLEEFEKLVTSVCYYCKSKGNSHGPNGKGIYCGIDRKNNSEGYTLNNTVSCCKRCNRMKMELNQEDFLFKIKQIYENLNLGNNS